MQSVTLRAIAQSVVRIACESVFLTFHDLKICMHNTLHFEKEPLEMFKA